MQRPTGRKTAAAALLVVAFAFSTLAVQAINYRLLVVGGEGLGPANPLFARILQRSPQDQSGAGREGTGQSSAAKNPDIQLIELLVSVSENRVGTVRSVQGAPVNVTISRESAGRVFAFADLLAPEELGREPTGPLQITSGETDNGGTVRFQLPAGNYSILARHLGLTGNQSISLVAEQPQVTMRWVFYSRLEAPLLVQSYDANGDGIISPGEHVVLFYQTQSPTRPDQLAIIFRSQTESQIQLKIIDFLILSHGVLVTLTPVSPVDLSALSQQSTLLVGILWYQVTVSP